MAAQVDVAEVLPPALANRVQLQQVIISLVVNAVEAMVSIDAGADDEVIVTVRDVGVGIDDAHGGRFWATPNADHGASFHFTLPALR